MSCTIVVSNGKLTIADPLNLLKGRHHSQMAYFGFEYQVGAGLYTGKSDDLFGLLQKTSSYFSSSNIPYELTSEAKELQAKITGRREELSRSMNAGRLFKSGLSKPAETKSFMEFISKQLPRQMKEHQIKAALHILSVRNGANFSVPGSGKTTVILSIFSWLRSKGAVNSLFVVGPPSCFVPWRYEYEAVTGKAPSFEILAGGNVEERKRKYYAGPEDICDLYLTSFQTLQKDVENTKFLFNQRNLRFALVIDEAHYIKQIDGAWAGAVLAIAPFAEIRWVLTGTPFPHSYANAFNYFDALWPQCSPFSPKDRLQITSDIQKKKFADAATLLNSRIGPLFYRVRKKELGLSPQDFQPPTLVSMNQHERRIYDAIVEKIRILATEDDFQEFDLLTRLRKGRMIRLRQCLSYARLLGSAVMEYNENLAEGMTSLPDLIMHYDELEMPAKLQAVLGLVMQLRQQGEKVVIWSNFVGTLKLLQSSLMATGHRTELIYGDTPTEQENVDQELTRERIIERFVYGSNGPDVLVANPAACAESISLHKGCSHAIYYDLSYNCAQYLQSLDRIHRVGGSEDKVAHYYFLQYADTIDQDILTNLRGKSDNMSEIIDQDYPVYSLDMFAEDDELAAYERLFR